MENDTSILLKEKGLISEQVENFMQIRLIVNHKSEDGCLFYLVDWECTWESADQLKRNGQQQVNEYWRKLTQKNCCNFNDSEVDESSKKSEWSRSTSSLKGTQKRKSRPLKFCKDCGQQYKVKHHCMNTNEDAGKMLNECPRNGGNDELNACVRDGDNCELNTCTRIGGDDESNYTMTGCDDELSIGTEKGGDNESNTRIMNRGDVESNNCMSDGDDDVSSKCTKKGGDDKGVNAETKRKDDDGQIVKNEQKSRKRPRTCKKCQLRHCASEPCPFRLKKTCDTCGELYTGECRKCKYQCKECGIFCMKPSRLKDHIDVVHKRLMRYECDICHRLFAAKLYLRSHMEIHKQVPDYICKDCGKAFKVRNVFQRHRKIHSGVKPFHCDVCGKDFQQRVTLKVHSRIHSEGPKRFQCLVCNRDFNHKVSLKDHMMRDHNTNEQKAAVMIGLWMKYQDEEGSPSDAFEPTQSLHNEVTPSGSLSTFVNMSRGLPHIDMDIDAARFYDQRHGSGAVYHESTNRENKSQISSDAVEPTPVSDARPAETILKNAELVSIATTIPEVVSTLPHLQPLRQVAPDNTVAIDHSVTTGNSFVVFNRLTPVPSQENMKRHIDTFLNTTNNASQNAFADNDTGCVVLTTSSITSVNENGPIETDVSSSSALDHMRFMSSLRAHPHHLTQCLPRGIIQIPDHVIQAVSQASPQTVDSSSLSIAIPSKQSIFSTKGLFSKACANSPTIVSAILPSSSTGGTSISGFLASDTMSTTPATRFVGPSLTLSGSNQPVPTVCTSSTMMRTNQSWPH